MTLKDLAVALKYIARELGYMGLAKDVAEREAPAVLLETLTRLAGASEHAPIDVDHLDRDIRRMIEAAHLSCLTTRQGHHLHWLTERGIAVLDLLRRPMSVELPQPKSQRRAPTRRRARNG